jgi:DNA adenine methylase
MNVSGTIAPFQYLGGKYSVLNWLLPLLPDTKSFVDVFGGSACVILNKKPAQLNTYNDLNGWVVTFFRVLRDRPDELIRLIELTPHSIEEYKKSWVDPAIDDIENARRFFVRTRQSFLSSGSQNKLKGWLCATSVSRVSMSEATSKWLGSVKGLQEVAERLRSIQIENRSWEFIFDNYDFADSLLYCDPPYDPEKRSGSKDYTHDFAIEDHIRLHERCNSVKGMVAVSGYNSDLMRSLWEGWHLTVGPERKNNFSKKKGVRECLWTNYDPSVEIYRQPKLFEE